MDWIPALAGMTWVGIPALGFDFDLAFDVGSPSGAPRSAGVAGAVRRVCLRERNATEFTRRPATPSIAGQSPQATAPVGVAFFWLLFLAKQEK